MYMYLGGGEESSKRVDATTEASGTREKRNATTVEIIIISRRLDNFRAPCVKARYLCVRENEECKIEFESAVILQRWTLDVERFKGNVVSVATVSS